MAADGPRRIRALRAFAYSLDGVRLIAVAPGEEVSLRGGAAAGLVAEGYAVEAPGTALAASPSPAAAAFPITPTSANTASATGDGAAPRRRRAPDRRN